MLATVWVWPKILLQPRDRGHCIKDCYGRGCSVPMRLCDPPSLCACHTGKHTHSIENAHITCIHKRGPFPYLLHAPPYAVFILGQKFNNADRILRIVPVCCGQWLYQMGSQMKREVFTERVAKGLRHWHSTARKNLSRDRSTSTRPSPRTSFSDGQTLYLPQHDHLHSSAATSSLASPEISEETVQPDTPPPPAETSFSTNPEITEVEVQPKIITRGSYDGEISFASTWKVQ